MVNRLKDGKLLIRVRNQKQAKKIMTITTIPDYRGEIEVKTKEHPTLNTCKGLIRCPDIEFLTEEEIMAGLKEQRVEEASIMKRKVNDKLVNTRTTIITFKAGKVPLMLRIEPTESGIVHPKAHAMQNMHEARSHKTWCKKERICANCSEPIHPNTCTKIKCVSCGEPHNTLDKNCPIFQDEMEIRKKKKRK